MSTNDPLDIAVIGAGAAGLMAAISAARAAPGLRIGAFDGATRPGAKILVSGGGRCNVVNNVVRPEDYSGSSRNSIRNVLAAWPVSATLEFFTGLGVSLHEEEYGKLFPDTNQARTVLEALLGEAGARGVGLLAGHRVTSLERQQGGFLVGCGADRWPAGRVVMCTGGLSLPKTGSDGFGYQLVRQFGHSLVPTTPALASLVLDGAFHVGLSGIAHDVVLTLTTGGPGRAAVTRIAGPMLWTHFGISGPAAMDVSRHWHRAVLEGKPPRLTANLMGGLPTEQAEARLLGWTASSPRGLLRTALAQLVPARLAEAVLAEIDVRRETQMSQLSRDVRRRTLAALAEWPLPVRDSRGYLHAEVTAGGVPLAEVDTATMASRVCPGLHLAGEILDVDGRLGGFNFQWAWASGFLAGKAAATR